MFHKKQGRFSKNSWLRGCYSYIKCVLCRNFSLDNSQARKQGIALILQGWNTRWLTQLLGCHFRTCLRVGVKLVLWSLHSFIALRSKLKVGVSLCGRLGGTVPVSHSWEWTAVAHVMDARCWPWRLLTCCWYLFQMACTKKLFSSCFYLQALMLGFRKDTAAWKTYW